MKRLTNLSAIFFGIIFILASCKKEDPVPNPTVNFIADVTNYEVRFTVEATDAASYLWDYGNGETSTQAGSHSYTYEESGDYTVKVTVTNESGSASKDLTVSIAASMMEQLAGAAGKTWIMDRAAPTNLQKIEPALTIWDGLPGGALDFFGLEAEYDNTYTFKPDGGYEIDGVNGAVLTGLVYTFVNELEIIVPPNSTGAGLAGAAFTNITDAKFTLHEGKDLTLTVANEDYPAGTNSEGVKEVTFPNANYIEFSEGAFLGIRDFTTSVMIRNITKDKMDITIFLSSLDPTAVPESFQLPSLAISTTLKVK